ncbi:MAG: S24/S26 family peptidase [Clostridia bacterium]|nr:S24/S26 family peptidase [Clostridia bacterium]
MELKDTWPIIEEVISSGGEFHLAPHGNSMLPLIKPGKDTVVLVAPTDLKEQDIVLYRRANGQFILHRIMYIKKDHLLMCGDNLDYYEYEIKLEDILAKVKDILIDGKTKVDTTSRKYKKYVKSRYRKVRVAQFKNFLYRLAKPFIKNK